MNRPTTVLAVAAVSAALLTGCGGKKEDATVGCKAAITARYKAALDTLSKLDSSTSNEEAVSQFQKAIGAAAPPECAKVNDDIVSGITDQVALELNVDD